MRIALVTETFPPEVNGVSRTLERLVTGLVTRGHEVEVVRPRRDDLPEVADFERVLVPGASLPGYPGLRFGFWCRGRLRRRWWLEPPDVVHVATEGPLGLSAVAAARSLGLPVTSSFHTNFDQYGRYYGYGGLRRLARAYLRWFHNRAAATMAPGPVLRTLRSAGFERLRRLDRGVDGELFHPGKRSAALRSGWGVEGDDPVVAHVGRLAPEKNPDLLLRAFAAIARVRPGARFVLVGDGPARERLRRASPGLCFEGLRLGEELAARYASADLFLFPSLTETFGNVVLEAMASGVAVVAFGVAAAGQHLRPDVDGILVEAGDDDAFVAAATRAAKDPEGLRRMGRSARNRAESLTWSAVADRFEGLLREAVGRSGGVARGPSLVE